MWHSLWNDARSLNRLAALVTLVAMAMIGTLAVKALAGRQEFAITSVVVTGQLANADPSHIAAVVHHELRGTFFTIDLATARDALQRVTWVRRVAVRRQWPARIEIAIEEQLPLARWNDVALVNTQGEVFDAEYDDDLPSFYAPDGTASEVAARYREFVALLAASRDVIESLSRSARGAWDVKLDDGLVVALGREHISERWTRWVQIGERYRTGIAQGKTLTAIDMRYPNGFAARTNGVVAGPQRAAGSTAISPSKTTATAAVTTRVSSAKSQAKG